MSHEFDPGPVKEPFVSLARDYPGPEAYPPQLFRVEWGPVFHRGRLDRTAQVLILGQDPGQHESIARRCMVGEAGQRVQGFLHKLGIERSYVIINAFLYSVYGQPSHSEVKTVEPKFAPYREGWLDALLLGTEVRAVIAFGELAQGAFGVWGEKHPTKVKELAVKALPHPTYPEGSSHGDPVKKAEATKLMLSKWNEALKALDHVLTDPDVKRELVLYGTELHDQDRAQIPELDMPVGSPPWMRSLKQWATRKGQGKTEDEEAESKRATIEVRIPTDERIWD
jgi:uracil-DNA glycosylase